MPIQRLLNPPTLRYNGKFATIEPVGDYFGVPALLAQRAYDRWLFHLGRCRTCQHGDEKMDMEALCADGRARLDRWLGIEEENGTLDED